MAVFGSALNDSFNFQTNCGNSKPPSVAMTVVVNLREPPSIAEELTKAKNFLHFEVISIPMSNDLNTILSSIKSQLDIFKSS